jgi:glycosyltransferase involved in cell wall biosynthesis
MTGPLRIACCSPIQTPGWKWISRALESDRFTWQFFNTAPRNGLERRISKPNMARLRACRETARYAERENADLIVTHAPLVTCWTELLRRRSEKRRAPHLAFSLNFTHLPSGVRHALMRRAFATVDRFVVFSTFERSLYSERFGIPLEKIDMIHWGVQAPPEDARGPLISGEYICAVGSQGRDYPTLIEAMRRLPHLRLVLVANPENVAGIEMPANVQLFTNIPRDDCSNIIRHSRFMVLPLLHSEVPCGHVTLVTAMYLAKAILATESAGITDYVHPGIDGEFTPSGDATALAANIDRLWRSPAKIEAMGTAGREFALEHCSEKTTVEYMRALLDRLAPTGTI